MLAAFNAAGLSVAAFGGGDTGFAWRAFFVGLGLTIVIFFQMRVCDEIKDLEDDQTYRPERPIPRGLISLRQLVGLGLATAILAIILALSWGGHFLWLLILVWIWLLAMTVEFGVPEWLKARAALYLLSHMIIMPLIALMVSGLIWMDQGAPSPAVLVFLALAFANGCVLEIGRKLLLPAQERTGVDTYSKLWGIKTGPWFGSYAFWLP